MRKILVIVLLFGIIGAARSEIIPFNDCELLVKLEGFSTEKPKIGKDKTIYIFGYNDKINISIFLKKTAGKYNSKMCMDEFWNRSKNTSIEKFNIKKSEINQTQIVEWETKSPFRVKNINAYLGCDNVCVDIHLSSSDFDTKNLQKLISIVKSLELRKATKNSTLLFHGGLAYSRNDYKKAISTYTKLEKLEKQVPKLDKESIRDFKIELAISYAYSGDMDKCLLTLTKALKNDPDYPLFHYNIACAYAEMDDLDKSMEHLKLAFKNKQFKNVNTTIPDPSKDSSLRRLEKYEKFRDLLEKIKKENFSS